MHATLLILNGILLLLHLVIWATEWFILGQFPPTPPPIT
jgi:hypothetical protein